MLLLCRGKTPTHRKNMPYRELDVSRPDVLDQLLELIPKVKTVPQIFIDGTHIGGYTELVDYLK